MIIVKVGGGKTINLEGIARDLSQVKDRFIIVLGANSLRDEIAERLGIKTNMVKSISGYSSTVSDQDVISLQMMVYAGLRSKRFIELCHQNHVNGIGLSGIDGGIVKGIRNEGIKVSENGRKRLIRDYSGKPEKINIQLLNALLDLSLTPVITVPILDQFGYAVNTENDDIVFLLQSQTRAAKVIQLVEAAGILQNPDDPESVISRLTFAEISELKKTAEARFKRKLLSFEKYRKEGNCKIIIADGRVENPLLNALLEKGTVIE
jgi:acetylglutamate/LysW-gamma-L-alpha-aminoadipate kinase